MKKKLFMLGTGLLFSLMLVGCTEEDGFSEDPADYDADGNYSPIDDMSDAEVEAELEEMLEDAIEE